MQTTSKMNVQFLGNLIPNSPDSLHYLCVLPESVFAPKKDDKSKTLLTIEDPEVIERCKHLTPSMLANNPDPSHPRCGIRWLAGGGERVVPKGATISLPIDIVRFLENTTPKGFLKVLGETTDVVAADGVLVAANNRLQKEVDETQARLDDAERRRVTAQASADAFQSQLEVARDELERTKQKNLELETRAKKAEEAEKHAEKKLKEATDKSEVLPLKKKLEEVSEQLRTTTAALEEAKKTKTV